ncbi:MAG: 4-hydroxy-3-methylbut-2-enyl diphosphate reductase, partial [Pseudobutyrivibrio sp.]|nr:4-hydroxy-3-methylbut-2-enyl diphosphate reductase [Pseudobutyrivibrio sp.]
MEIKLANSAGFCFGVKRAVDVVEDKIKTTEGPIYTYGPIIHNEEVVNRFKKMGVEVMEEDSDKNYPVGTVIIRSHGITKTVEDKLKADGHTVIDATCPFVKKIHKIVLEHSTLGEYIVIIGNPLHPEVKGITGWINGNDFSVISNIDEVCQLSVNIQQTICIVSQTTFNHNKFEEIVEKIKEKGYHV